MPIVSEWESASVPPVTVTAPVSASVVPLVLASVSVPTRFVVPPVKVLAPVRVTLPMPDFSSVPVPLMTPA